MANFKTQHIWVRTKQLLVKTTQHNLHQFTIDYKKENYFIYLSFIYCSHLDLDKYLKKHYYDGISGITKIRFNNLTIQNLCHNISNATTGKYNFYNGNKTNMIIYAYKRHLLKTKSLS